MKITKSTIKSIIMEELQKVLENKSILKNINESIEEKTPEEKALSLEQQNALKTAASKLDGKHYDIEGFSYKASAEYIKRNKETGKPRHIKGDVSFAGKGYNFEVTYDANTKNFTMTIADLSKEGNNLSKMLKDLINEAAAASIPEEEIGFKIPAAKHYSSSDWEGGERDPSKSGKIPGLAGTYTALPYFSGKDKWSRTR